MSSTISGWVEVHHGNFRAWTGVINVGELVFGHHDAFACLFGVRNHAGFRPLAAARGVPEDASDSVRSTWDIEDPNAHGHTWISWAELAAMDPTEHSTTPEHYLRGALPPTIQGGVAVSVPRAGGAPSMKLRAPVDVPADAVRSADGQLRWTDQHGEHELRTMTRAEALNSREWQLVFKLMATLAEEFGADGVRLVVWFDD